MGKNKEKDSLWIVCAVFLCEGFVDSILFSPLFRIPTCRRRRSKLSHM